MLGSAVGCRRIYVADKTQLGNMSQATKRRVFNDSYDAIGQRHFGNGWDLDGVGQVRFVRKNPSPAWGKVGIM